MELFGLLLDDYISPVKCLLDVYQEHVLENGWICCGFWYAKAFLDTRVESRCGPDMVDMVEQFLHYAFDDARSKCSPQPAYCTLWLVSVLTLMGAGFLLVLWSFIVTLLWWRLGRRSKSTLDTETKEFEKLFCEDGTVSGGNSQISFVVKDVNNN